MASELEATQRAAQKKYNINQEEINPGGKGRVAAVLGETVNAARKKYFINQTENIVPGSTHPSDVRTESPKN